MFVYHFYIFMHTHFQWTVYIMCVYVPISSYISNMVTESKGKL